MLFNSYSYLFLFLPVLVFSYHVLLRKSRWPSCKYLLIAASLFFYASWDIRHLPLLLISIGANHFFASSLSGTNRTQRRVLAAGVLFNILFLVAFKYLNWIVAGANSLLNTSLPLLNIGFPPGISFFSFVQIAYLVDLHGGKGEHANIGDYVLFVSFFPKLMQGPIVRHDEMLPQLGAPSTTKPDYGNIATGLFLFSMGLFKKVIIADFLAGPVQNGFDRTVSLDFVESWISLLCYTFQIYFDFSGYTDMALGTALLFNIRLPINFLSPYKATDIQDFWRRWHITLGRFLRDYVYIPLGGNRHGEIYTYRNLVLTFIVAGIWHGAGLNFALWGLLHGFGLAAHRLWTKLAPFRLPKFLGWFITFLYVSFAWIFFRANTWDDAIKVLKGCLGFSGFSLPYELSERLGFLKMFGVGFDTFMTNLQYHERDFWEVIIYMTSAGLIAFLAKNSVEQSEFFKADAKSCAFAALLITYAILGMQKPTGFVYFSF